jgi:RecA-family ATPase
MDRASGSGVFARDPDALLDLIELDMTEDLRKQEENKAICRACCAILDAFSDNWEDEVSQDDQCSAAAMQRVCEKLLSAPGKDDLQKAIAEAREQVQCRTAWRIEGTMREFPKFAPINLWFDYPVHHIDKSGSLLDVQPDNEGQQRFTWKRNFGKKKTEKQRAEERKNSVDNAFEACRMGGEVTIAGMAEYMGVSEKTARNRIKEHGGFWAEDGEVGRKGREKVE